VLQLRTLLRRIGFQSDIWFEHLDPRLAGEARPYTECDPAADPQRLILYHASTHTDMNAWLVAAASAGQRVVVDYHNMTPAEYFAPWQPRAAISMQDGRRQLAELAPHVVAAVADSDYNAAELAHIGMAGAATCPILLDLDEYHRPPDRRLEAGLAGHPRWLFVGRVAPNKCQHDVIAAFAAYRKLYAPESRLAIVGGITSARYQEALDDLVEDLGVADSVEFPESAPFPELLAHYGRADVFVCLSEHEGFCVPVIEAMELGVPVVAYAAAAVPETVAGAGVLLADKDPLAVAVAVHDLLSDPDRRAALIGAGRARAGDFALPATAARWEAELRRIWSVAGETP